MTKRRCLFDKRTYFVRQSQGVYFRPVNSKETGTIPASRILKPLWRLTCRSSPVLLNDKALQHSRVFAIHGCPQRPYKFGFTQSYGKSYGGIVPVFIEFTDFRHGLINYCPGPPEDCPRYQMTARDEASFFPYSN